MLTNKRLFQKTLLRYSNNSLHQFSPIPTNKKVADIDNAVDVEPVSPVSVTVTNESRLPSDEALELAIVDGAVPIEQKKAKREVRFDKLMRVTLIPCLQEYLDAKVPGTDETVHGQIWNSPNELQVYKESAKKEIFGYLEKHGLFASSENMKAAIMAIVENTESNTSTMS